MDAVTLINCCRFHNRTGKTHCIMTTSHRHGVCGRFLCSQTCHSTWFLQDTGWLWTGRALCWWRGRKFRVGKSRSLNRWSTLWLLLYQAVQAVTTGARRHRGWGYWTGNCSRLLTSIGGRCGHSGWFWWETGGAATTGRKINGCRVALTVHIKSHHPQLVLKICNKHEDRQLPRSIGSYGIVWNSRATCG